MLHVFLKVIKPRSKDVKKTGTYTPNTTKVMKGSNIIKMHKQD